MKFSAVTSGLLCFLLAILALEAPAASASNNEFRLESGLFHTGYNKFSIPGSSGSRVFLSDQSKNFYYRISALFPLDKQSYLRLLAAPLQAKYNFTPPSPILFNGSVFAENASTESTYKFDSYRAAYLYRFPLTQALTAQIGGVAKIRVAKTALRNSSISNEYKNVGFVPLLNLGAFWSLTPAWEIRVDVDGAVASQGRAIDGSIELFYRLTDKNGGLSAGYRALEGGADNAKVYTFALFHYSFLAVTFGF